MMSICSIASLLHPHSSPLDVGVVTHILVVGDSVEMQTYRLVECKIFLLYV